MGKLGKCGVREVGGVRSWGGWGAKELGSLRKLGVGEVGRRNVGEVREVRGWGDREMGRCGRWEVGLGSWE